jgi:hypothetical protein
MYYFLTSAGGCVKAFRYLLSINKLSLGRHHLTYRLEPDHSPHTTLVHMESVDDQSSSQPGAVVLLLKSLPGMYHDFIRL